MRAFAQEHGVDRSDVVDLTLAVTEAVTNAVIHAFIDREPGPGARERDPPARTS